MIAEKDQGAGTNQAADQDLSRTRAVEPGSGAAIQGTDARLSDGRWSPTTTCRRSATIRRWPPIWSANSKGEQFRVLDPANLPDRPSFPNRPLFALGGFGAGLGLGVGAGVVYGDAEHVDADANAMWSSRCGCQCWPWFRPSSRFRAKSEASETAAMPPVDPTRESRSEGLSKTCTKNSLGFAKAPSTSTPTPLSVSDASRSRNRWLGLTYGIQNRKGFILLTGEVGTGKTTLLNRLLDWLHGQRVATAYIFNSQAGREPAFRFHHGGIRDSLRIAGEEPGSAAAEPMAAGPLSRRRNGGADRGRGAEPSPTRCSRKSGC